MANVSAVNRASALATRFAQANQALQRNGINPDILATLGPGMADQAGPAGRYAESKMALPSILNEQNILGWDAKMRGNAMDLSSKLDAEKAIADAEIAKNNAIAEAQAKARRNAWKGQLASTLGIGAGILMPYLIPGIAGLAAGAAAPAVVDTAGRKLS